jgi:Big-like domain-containing protein/PKD domain-containing protein
VSRTFSAIGLALTVVSGLAFFPSAVQAQKGLVYCPVSVDATGCGPIVTAIAPDFPDGVETAFDGSSGTIDLATADLSAYAVLVVPSLADGAGAEPYRLLRDGAIAGRLSPAFNGRNAVWSGTPDHGTTNRAAKDALLRNLAGWARSDAAAGRGPGIVVLQDNSDDGAARYGWLRGISGLSVVADTTFEVYSNVQVLTATGRTILTSGGLQIGYTNMASYGLVASGGSSSDATGGRSGRVVLVTMAGDVSAAASGIATVATDKEDYQPGDTVTVTGTGWDPGETVSLLFHEDVDPPVHPDKTYTTVADADGHILNHGYEIDELDLNVRFTLTATGQTSGNTAQATFTDAISFGGILVGTQSPSPVAPGASATYPITIQFNGNNTPGCSVSLSVSGFPTGVAGSLNPSSVSSGGTDQTSTLTVTTSAATTATGTTTFTVQGVGTACTGTKTATGTLVVKRSSTTTVTGPASSSFAQSVTFTATVTGAGATPSGSVQFKDGAANLGGAQTLVAGAASIASSSLTLGGHTITAVYAGDANYTESTSLGFTHTVNKADQTITFTSTAPTAAVVGGTPYTATAGGGASGNSVTFSSLTTGVCTSGGTNGATISFIAVGTCTVAANQAGNTNYNAASQLTQGFQVGKGSQTITFTSTAPTAAAIGGSYTATATASSGLTPVLFSSLTTGVCTSSGTNGATISFIAAGSCSVAADQAGNTNYNPATQATQSFTVVAVDLTINKSHTGSFTQGVNGTYSLVVSNAAGAATTGTITVTDVLPAGLGFVSAIGTNWTCTFATGTVTCTRTAVITAPGSATITLTVSVGAAAVPSVTNVASVSGGGEPAANNGNNSDSDPTTVNPPANVAPVATDDNYNVNEDQTLTIAAPGVLGNDTDANGDALTAQLQGGGGTSNGTLSLAANGGFTYTPNANFFGSDQFMYRASDGTTTSGNAKVIITVNPVNDPPSFAKGADQTAQEGSGLHTVTGWATAISAGPANESAQTLTFQVTANTNASLFSVQPAVSATGTLTYTLAATGFGPADVTLVLKDNGGTTNGGQDTSPPQTFKITVTANNQAPVVDAGGPYTGNEGSAIALNTATATDPDAGDTPTYKWSYVAAGPIDLGTTCSFSNDAIVQPTFTCNDDGSFTVTLTVNDGHSHIAHDDAGVTVANVKPVANAGGGTTGYSGDEGSVIQLSGSGDDPGNNDDDPKLTYKWTVNTTGIDVGGTCAFDDDTKKDAKVTCTDNSNADPFTLTLVATDDDGASSTGATAALTVKNAEPVADAGGPYDGNEGSAISLNGSVTDAGSNDTHTWSWAYVAGAGVDAGATCSFSSATAEDPTITCTDDGTVELTFTAKDDNGGTGSDKAQLTVKNVAPVAHAGGPYSGKEGEAIGLAGSATDAGTNDGFTYKWTVDVTGIDAGGACTFDDDTKTNAKVTCTDNSNATPFTLKLVATDDDGLASAMSQTNLTVANADPVADAGGPYDGNEGSPVSLNGSATDVGSNDTFTWKWVYEAGVNVDAGATCSFSDIHVPNPTITCTDDGTVKLTLTVKDDNGGESNDEATLSLANVKPVASAAGPYTGDEGSAIELNGSADDPGNNDDPYLTYLWTVNTTGIDAGGTCTFDDATKKNAKVTCTDDSKSGTFKLSLVASDDDGGTSTASYADLTVLNVAPVAEAGGPYDGNEGSPVSLNGSATDVGSNDTFTWKWVYEAGANVDAGATCSFSDIHAPNPTITCTDDGTVKLTLTVKDDNGDESNDEATLSLANVKPVATAGAPSSGDEGSALQLNGSATDAGTNDQITYKWTADVTGITNNGHCTFDDATKKDAKVTCDDNGTLKLTLTATDDDGGVGTDVAEIAIANVDPVANAGGGTTKSYSGNEGSAVQLYGSATDAGSNDTFTWAWEYTAGPGFINGATCQFDHADVKQPKITCNDNGTVKLTLTVTDDDGGKGVDGATLNVANVDPVADAGGPYTGNEGEAISLNSTTTDAGGNDTHIWQWKYVAGDGFVDGATCTFSSTTAEDPTITCTDNGTVQLTFTAKDDDGGEGSDGATLTLKNVAPVAKAGGPYSGVEGAAIALDGSATDAGANDVLSYKWTVNTAGIIDNGGSCTFDNDTYKNAKVTCTDDSGTGHFTLSLVATDDDGGVSVASTTNLTVTNANPVPVAAGPYTGTEGAAIQLNGSATDPGSNDAVAYKWTINTTGIDAGGNCSFDSDIKRDAKVTCTDDSGAGTFALTLTATDDDGGSASSNTTLTLQNVKPTIAGLFKLDGITPLPATIIVAGTLPIKVPFSDPATNDTHTAQIDCGMGTYASIGTVTPGFQTSCTFATIGSKTIKVKVTDDDGGYDEKSQTITVKYLFDGFYAPVDRPNTMNLSKAGQAIPLKWRLTNALGAPITDLTGVTVQATGISCSLSTSVDQIEEYAAGASGLLNLGNGNYQFNWKTPTTYANSCKSIALVFGAGGTSYTENPSAYFTFKP